MKISNQISDQGSTLTVSEAKAVDDYKIDILFSNGENVIADFYEFLSSSKHPEIRKYLSVSLFRSFKIVDGNLNWNDYDMIFPIEDLYRNDILHTSKLVTH